MLSTARVGRHPIHTLLVHFPIAFWTAAFIADIVAAAAGYSHTAAFYLIAAGCVGAALAAVFGTIDLIGTVLPSGSSRARGVARMHALANVLGLGAWLASALTRPAPELTSTTAWITESVGFVLLVVAGYLGGRLVYEFRIGVAEATPVDVNEVQSLAAKRTRSGS